MIARNLRPGDRITYYGEPVTVKQTDNVDGFIEIVTECGHEWFVRWDHEYVVSRPNPQFDPKLDYPERYN